MASATQPSQPAPAPAERQHVRTVNGDTPEPVDTRDALAEETSIPAARPAAEVLAADPIPAQVSVLEGMPGREITREELRTLRTPREVLAHDAYIVQLRDAGAWTLPNHDDGAEMDCGQVAHVLRRTLDSAPGRARTSLDTDGTVYTSNGRRAARFIPVERFARYTPGQCPGCHTWYTENGDGPCTGGRSSAPREAGAEHIRTEAAREAYAHGVRLEAQQLATNQVIEERARDLLASVLQEEAAEGKAGFVFRTNHRAVRVRAVTSEGDDWPLLTEALQLHFEHYGWFTETTRGQGLRLAPPGDATELAALVTEGQRRSVNAAHEQALAENVQR